MKKILVTGGAGYIGSHTCVELFNAGFIPVIVDNFSNSDVKVISSLNKITGSEIKVYNADCANFQELEQVFEAEEDLFGVIHFAAFKAVGESVENPNKYYHNNVNSTLNLLELMKRFNVGRLVFSSSCTVYGQPENLPVTEESPLAPPESPYGHTKQICERMIQYFHHSYSGLRTVVLRYFNPIGAHPSALIGELPIGKPENLVPYITQTAAGIREQLTVFGNDYNTPDGTCIRDYIHVSDLARAHVKSIEFMDQLSAEKPLEIINLGLGRGFSVLEVIKAFEKVSGIKLNYKIGQRRKGDVEKIFSSSDKANKLLNWKCEYGLEEMLLHSWNWQKSL